MEPKKPETMEERMQAMEIEFSLFKEDTIEGNAAMCQDIEKSLSIGRSNEQAILGMPGKIVQELDKRGGKRWATANQWILVGIAIAAPFVAKWLGV